MRTELPTFARAQLDQVFEDGRPGEFDTIAQENVHTAMPWKKQRVSLPSVTDAAQSALLCDQLCVVHLSCQQRLWVPHG